MAEETAAADRSVPVGQAGYLELVRGNVHFRRLWLGEVVSLLGDWFNTIALYSLIVTLTGSPLALGIVFVTKMLPLALASPIAGILVDRYNRRRIMIGSNLLRAVVVLGFLFIDEASEAYWIYVLTTLQVVFGAVYYPAQNASIPNITTPRELLTANAILSATWSVMLAVGAGLGGFAAEAFGLNAVFLLDSATYLVAAFFIYRAVIPQDTEEAVPGAVLATAHRKVKEGWQHVRTHPPIARMTLAKATWAMAGGGLVYFLTLLGNEILPQSMAQAVGLLYMLRGLGTGIGPIVARAFFRDQQRWPFMLGVCISFSGAAYFVVSWLPWAYTLGAFSLVGLLVVSAHATSGANWVLSSVLLQHRTADRFRGRVFATEWLVLMVVEALSIFAASLLLQMGWLDLRSGFATFALLQVASGLVWLVTVVPRERADQQQAIV